MLVLPLHLPMSSKNSYVAGKKVKIGMGVAKKQPQVVMIPPHMVQKLYCERYLSIQSMLGKKREKN